MSFGKQKALDKAANEAVFVNQLQLDRAVKYVLNRVRGSDINEATRTINEVMVSYKS